MRGPVLGLIVLAVIFALIAVLYWVGAIQLFVSHAGPGVRHTTHAWLFAILAVLSLVAANFMRSRTSA